MSGADVLAPAAAIVVVSSGRLTGASVVVVLSDPMVVLALVVVGSEVDGASATVLVGDGSELGGLGTSCAPA